MIAVQLTDVQRENILRSLKRHAKVILNKNLYDGKKLLFEKVTICRKQINGDKRMTVIFSDGDKWRLMYSTITCEEIITAESL